MRAFALAVLACCLSIPAHANRMQKELDVMMQDVELAQFMVHVSWMPECPGVTLIQRMKEVSIQIFQARGASMKHDAFKQRMDAELARSFKRTPAERCYAAIQFLRPYEVFERR